MQAISSRLMIPTSIILFLIISLISPRADARTLTLMHGQSEVTIDYGVRERDSHFADSLHFQVKTDNGNLGWPVADVEATCDCVTPSITNNGILTFDFHVEPAEMDGPTEKILYVFSDYDRLDLIRLKLRINVFPGGYLGTDTTGNIAEDGQTNLDIDKETDVLDILYFGSPGCQTCKRVHDLVLPQLRKDWGDRINLIELNMDDNSGYAMRLAMREHYGEENRRSPFAFYIGEQVILGRKDVFARVNSAIVLALGNGTQTFIPSIANDGEDGKAASQFFLTLNFWAVLGAGLLDGINPCAFATIVFFISLLGYAGSSKRQILVVGIGFTASVFTVYLLLGLGAFKALQALAIYSIIAKIILGLTFLLVAVLFVLSLRDTLRYYRTGKTSDQTLQLSKENKRRIHTVMKRGMKTGNLLAGAIGIGALVSLFEAACTGQVYLPTIILVLQDPSLRTNAFTYLILYNLMFILPLVIVFALTYGGMASERFARWSKDHFGHTRIALTLLFLLLAVLMGFEVLAL